MKNLFIEKPIAAFLPSSGTVKPPSRLGAIIASILLFCAFIVACLAPILAPFDHTLNVAPPFSIPNNEFLLGTDQLGRDSLSRLIYGLRNLFWIGLATAILSITIGFCASVTAQVLGGWVNKALFVLAHSLSSLPPLLWGFFFGVLVYVPSSLSLIVALTIPFSSRVFRFCSSEKMEKSQESAYEASKSTSAFLWFGVAGLLVRREATFLLAMFAIVFNTTVLVDFSLSFLGIGIQPPEPSLGRFVTEQVTLISFGELTPGLPLLIVIPLVVSVYTLIDYALRRTGRDLVPSIRSHGPVWDLQQ
ncbi:MAG: hypothetical protein AAFV74_15370 [Pseudomonadota bacterium]